MHPTAAMERESGFPGSCTSHILEPGQTQQLMIVHQDRRQTILDEFNQYSDVVPVQVPQ